MIKVVKFGGSSLADAEQFQKVRSIITADESRVYVVPSAPGRRYPDDVKVTDMLIRMYETAVKGEDFSVELAQIRARFQEIIDGQKTDDSLKTYAYEVHLWEAGSAEGKFVAYRQEVYVVPTSYGGDTTGYQIPFEVHYVGERVLGDFTPASGSTSVLSRPL